MKAKAKMRYTNIWIYGELVKMKYIKECIDDKIHGLRAIDPRTICKETNVKNKNNVMIFVNDIVIRGFKRGIVIEKNNKFYIKWSSKDLELLTDNIKLDIVGNKVW